MDQIQKPVSPSRELSDEVSAVYDLIINYRSNVLPKANLSSDSTLERLVGWVTAGALIIIGGLMAALYLLPPTTWGDTAEDIRLVLQIAVLAIYFLGGGVLLFQYFSLKHLYKDFTGQMIDVLSEAARDEAELFEALDSKSTHSIQYVANRFEQMSTQLGGIRSFLLGAIEKVGIIPGLIATVVAISKVADGTGVSWLEWLSFSMCGIYLTMFPITGAAIRIKRYSILLNQYLTFVRSSEEHADQMDTQLKY